MELSSFLSLVLATVASAQANGHWRFRVHATTVEGVTPSQAGFMELSDSGSAGFVNGAVNKGFVSFMDAAQPSMNPYGKLFREDSGAQAFLAPTAETGLYDLKYGAVPVPADSLSDAFTIMSVNCGGNCGGLALLYNPGISGSSFVAVPKAEEGEGYWIRWFNGSVPLPEGVTRLYLWREYEA